MLQFLYVLLFSDDSRIRVIPFATRRATFKELENVHMKLSNVIIEGIVNFFWTCG